MKYSLNKKGFTLAETLMAITILLMVTAIIAGGIPAAVRVYNTAIDKANAQVALSTTVTVLKDELSSAKDVETEGKNIIYTNGRTGVVNMIYSAEDMNIKLQEYANSSSADKPEPYSIVSEKAITDKLVSSFEEATYSNGIVTIRNLKISKDGNSSAELGELKIRVIND